MMPKAVIFDLDGTLFDKSRLPLYLVIRQLAKGKMMTLKRERSVRKLIKGKFFGSESDFYKAFFAMFGGEKARDWYFNTYMPDMTEILEKHYKVSGWAVELIRELRDNGVKIVVFSDYGSVNEKLKAIGMDTSLIDYTFDAPSLGGLKPCKEAFLALCQKINERPSDCVMIGDREDTDGNGARSVGMPFILVDKKGLPESANSILATHKN